MTLQIRDTSRKTFYKQILRELISAHTRAYTKGNIKALLKIFIQVMSQMFRVYFLTVYFALAEGPDIRHGFTYIASLPFAASLMNYLLATTFLGFVAYELFVQDTNIMFIASPGLAI